MLDLEFMIAQGGMEKQVLYATVSLLMLFTTSNKYLCRNFTTA